MNSCGTKPTVTAAYYNDASCTELRRMSLAAFHKLWFTIASAQLGFDGTSSWDLTGRLRQDEEQPVVLDDRATGGRLGALSAYYAFQLLLQTTAQGWQVLQVDPVSEDDEATRYDTPQPEDLEQELTAYSGSDGQLTVLGMDTVGQHPRRAER